MSVRILIGDCRDGGGTDSAPRIGTPAPFRDLLLSIARLAIADTHAKRGDVKQAPSLMSGGGAAQQQSPESSPS